MFTNISISNSMLIGFDPQKSNFKILLTKSPPPPPPILQMFCDVTNYVHNEIKVELMSRGHPGSRQCRYGHVETARCSETGQSDASSAPSSPL